MSLRYLSVCSGIEAASVAWRPLGWTPIGFSEIEPFPSAVLAHRFGSNMPGEPWSGNGTTDYAVFIWLQGFDGTPEIGWLRRDAA